MGPPRYGAAQLWGCVVSLWGTAAMGQCSVTMGQPSYGAVWCHCGAVQLRGSVVSLWGSAVMGQYSVAMGQRSYRVV